MAYFDRRKDNRGRKAKLGSLIITDDHRLAFFVAYCDCGCNAKIGLTPEESRIFAKRFHREGEPQLVKLVASPGRAIRYMASVIREAKKIAADQERTNQYSQYR